MAVSPNFAFLRVHDAQLVKIGTLAEKYFRDDPVTCLIKLRQFGELLAQLVAANVGLYTNPDETQLDLLNRLKSQNLLPGDAKNLFHQLRMSGNDAVHNNQGSHGLALHHIRYARELGIWFHRTFGSDSSFKPGAFIPPSNPEKKTEALEKELATLRAEAEASRSQAELAEAKVLEETELRLLAEELLEEAETELKQRLTTIQSSTASQSSKLIQQTVSAANDAEKQIDLDENETRRLLIDTKLREAGWIVDSDNLTYSKGTRPEKGKNLAIAEYPTKNGRADYALFVGLHVVAVVEAKRHSKDVSGDIDQAKRYSKGYQIKGGETFVDGSPWGKYKVPFVFAANGREYLEQLHTKSGIWFCDVRNPNNLRRPLQGWKSPEGLIKLLQQDKDKAHEKLEQEDFNYNIELRDYQKKAIKKVESALADNQRQLLLAMATGTGKTKTAILLVYRLLKAKRFNRVLFLVDRTALGEQATNSFKDTRIENLQTFADIFEIRELKENNVETETKVNIATVQSFDLSVAEQNFQRDKAFYGIELVQDAHRLLLMNLMLHGIEGKVGLGDSLSAEGQRLRKANVILTNPPFGTKKGGGKPTRDDFTYQTSNKQLAFLQHIYRGLLPEGRAAVVLPDNVLFEDGQGRSIRADLMDKCNLHTILRLPTGIFYAQGVKTNVLFFQRGTTEKGNTKEVWFYDLRTNMPSFGKRTPFTRKHFAEFETCYGDDPNGKGPRTDLGEEGRFRCFSREDITKRGENLDISWLRDESLQSAEDLPEPDEIAAEIMTRLQSAMEDMEALTELLDNPAVEEEAG